MNLTVSTASAQPSSAAKGMLRQASPFYPRFYTNDISRVDILAQDVSRIPDIGNPYFAFCSPPSMVGVLLLQLQVRQARAVFIVPDTRATWFPLMASATIRDQSVTTKANPGVFFRMHHRRGIVPVVFHKWVIKVVDVNFT